MNSRFFFLQAATVDGQCLFGVGVGPYPLVVVCGSAQLVDRLPQESDPHGRVTVRILIQLGQEVVVVVENVLWTGVRSRLPGLIPYPCSGSASSAPAVQRCSTGSSTAVHEHQSSLFNASTLGVTTGQSDDGYRQVLLVAHTCSQPICRHFPPVDTPRAANSHLGHRRAAGYKTTPLFLGVVGLSPLSIVC